MGFAFWKKAAPVVPDKSPRPDQTKPTQSIGFGAMANNDPIIGAMFDNYIGPVPNPNQILTYELGKAGAGYGGSPIDLLVEEYEKDPKIMGLVKSRIGNVLQMDAEIRQYGDTGIAQAASRLVDRVGEYLGSWHQTQEEMLERGICFGISVHEILWSWEDFPLDMGDRPRSKRWLIPTALQQVAQNRIAFDSKGNLMIYAMFEPEDAAARGYESSDAPDWWYPNPFNILTFTRYRQNSNPYGYPLLACLFYKAWFKRLMDKWWAQYNERNTQPLHWAEVDMDAQLSDDDKTFLANFMATVTRQTGAVFPAGSKLNRLEISGNAAQTFQSIIANFDDQAAILIVGQTSTSSAARQGSGAQSDVHERNALAIFSSDARCIEAAMNKFFRLIIEVNSAEMRFRCPKLQINTRSVDEMWKQAQTIEKWVGMGLKVPCRIAYRIGGIDEPNGDEKCLEMQPANYSNAFGKPPSQQTAQKTAAKAGQRDRAAAPRSQAQPRRPAGK